MRKKRPSKFEKGGLYIAICCFALIAAVIGYAGNKTTNENLSEDVKAPQLASEKNTPTPVTKYKEEDILISVKDADVPEAQEKTQTDKTANNNLATDNEPTEIAVSKTVEADDTAFSAPVKGDIIVSFSGDSLVYNEILSDWRTHNGVDISCDENAAIYAAADGIVEEVFETAHGKSVRIDHKNGFKSVYANLSDQIEVITGDELSGGDLIGKAGNSSVADFTDKPHLHFEILLNDAYVNPEDYIN